MVPGGKTPIVDGAVLASMGFAIVLYANAAFQGAVAGMQAALSELKIARLLDESRRQDRDISRSGNDWFKNLSSTHWRRKYSDSVNKDDARSAGWRKVL